MGEAMTIMPQSTSVRPTMMTEIEIDAATALPSAPLSMPTQELERQSAGQMSWLASILSLSILKAPIR